MKRTKNWFSVLPSLVIPVCLGLSLYLGLLALIDKQILNDETLLRYVTGHPVSRISVGLFLVGCSSLALIGWDIFLQFFAEKKITLTGLLADEEGPPSLGDEDLENRESVDAIADHAAVCSQELMALPQRYREHYLWQRLASGIQSIYRTGAVSKVEEELKYLADLDREKQQQRYSLVQILIWATPMLGFLGTVLGISQALGGIAVGPDNDFQQMMDGLKGSLYVAFDTTALALTLSMIMMFGQFLVDRFESQLLQLVDHRVHAEVTQQFDLSLSGGSSDPDGQILESRIVTALQMATEKQTEAWEHSVLTAGRSWSDSVQSTYDHIDQELNQSIDFSVSRLAKSLEEAIDRADLSMSHRWEQWQVMLSENARQIAKTQGELVAQTKVLCQLMEKQEAITSSWEKPATPVISAVSQIQPQEGIATADQTQGGKPTVPEQVTETKKQPEIPLQKQAQPVVPSSTPDPSLRAPSAPREKTSARKFGSQKVAQFHSQGMTSVQLDKLRLQLDQQVILPFASAKDRSNGLSAGSVPSANSVTPPSPARQSNEHSMPEPVIVPFIRKAA